MDLESVSNYTNLGYNSEQERREVRRARRKQKRLRIKAARRQRKDAPR